MYHVSPIPQECIDAGSEQIKQEREELRSKGCKGYRAHSRKAVAPATQAYGPHWPEHHNPELIEVEPWDGIPTPAPPPPSLRAKCWF